MAPKPPLPIRKPIHPSLSTTSKPPHKSSKAPTKRLKRESKHATLLSRISKTASGSKISKRRRPSKKLLISLDGLADALPEAPTPAGRETRDFKVMGDGEGKIKHDSLRSRPGAGKKKERLVAMERERLGKNMALMSTGATALENRREAGKEEEMGGGNSGAAARERGSAERWAAIRGFISQTMERRLDEVVGG